MKNLNISVVKYLSCNNNGLTANRTQTYPVQGGYTNLYNMSPKSNVKTTITVLSHKNYLDNLFFEVEKFNYKSCKITKSKQKYILHTSSSANYYNTIIKNYKARHFPIIDVQDYYCQSKIKQWKTSFLISKLINRNIPFLISSKDDLNFKIEIVCKHLTEYNHFSEKKISQFLKKSEIFILQNKDLIPEKFILNF